MKYLRADHSASKLQPMSAAPVINHISVEDYLSGEPLSEVRHEYIAGQVSAMAGASRNHNFVAGQCYATLLTHLNGSPCRPYIGDVKVRLLVNQKDIFYYPDVVVGCDPRDTHDHYLKFPKLIIEVLSESTQRLDRLEKFSNYITLDSLEEYVLLAQDKPEVTLFRRRTGWSQEIYSGLGARIILESVDLTISLAEIYQNVTVAAQQPV